ncbi:MAG: hypothetical protein VW881_04720, partial [Alphaproteobacteria bacterium]
NTLTTVLVIVAVTLLLCGMSSGSLVLTTLLMMLCFAALGAGNGALFQLVPLRWPLTTAVAGSMIGEIGALGGGLVPNAMGLSKQYTGTYFWGFALFAVLSLAVLGMMRFMGYCLSSASMGGAFQAFIAGSPIALIVVMGLSPEEYGWFILEVPFGYVVGNFISSRLSQRIPRERMILTGGLVASTATCSAVVLSLMGMDTPVTLIVPMFFYAVGSGFLIPNALSGALTSVEPSSAGAAAAVSGFLQMGAGFLATVAIAALEQTSYLQVGGVMFCCTMLSWLIFLALGTRRA